MEASPSAATLSRDIEPVEHETAHRIITGLVTGLPFLALTAAAWRAWDGLLKPSDIAVFVILYTLTGLGVTVGFHRLLTHRSFKTGPVVRGVLAVLGSAAIEGPVISWVSDHRRHHAFSDQLGDPHSPHVDHGVGVVSARVQRRWRSGLTRTTSQARPHLSSPRMTSAERSTWARPRPCAADVGNAWWLLCHDSPNDGSASQKTLRDSSAVLNLRRPKTWQMELML